MTDEIRAKLEKFEAMRLPDDAAPIRSSDWFGIRLAIAAIAAVLLAVPVSWVVKSYFEAKSYNRLTGAHATTWDAMWVELRVQDSPKAQ